MHMKCRSEAIFEAVAENFVCNAESHTSLQIAKQIIAMGSLNYLPQVRTLHKSETVGGSQDKDKKMKLDQ